MAQRKSDRSARIKLALGLVLVILVLLLGVLGVFFVKVLAPAGVTKADAAPQEGFEWVRSIYGFGKSPDAQLLSPTSVAIGSDGSIYATDPQRARIMVFSPDGTFRRMIQTGAEPGMGKGQIARPESLAMDRASNELYVLDSAASKIAVVDSGGRVVREWPVENMFGIDVVGDEVIGFARGSVVTFSKQGEKLGSFGSPGRGEGPEIESGYAITADAKRIYVGDGLNNAIKAFTRDGKLVWVQSMKKLKGSAEDSETASELIMQLPQDLVFDAAGRLIAVDAFSMKLLILDPETGEVVKYFGEDGKTDGKFLYPTGLAFDPQRDWFAVADTANNRVQIVRLAGSGGGAVSGARRLLASPFRLCAVPFLLLLLGIAIMVLTSRRRDADKTVESAVPTSD